MSISAETLIHTLRGQIPAHKLAAVGDRARCLTWRGDRITFAEISVVPAGDSECCRVVFDHGRSMIVATSTQFLGRRGDVLSVEQAASFLADSDDAVADDDGFTPLSVMPIVTGRNNRGYPVYRQIREDARSAPAAIDRKSRRPIARMVLEETRGERIPAGMYVRHNDGDVNNCEPENLRLEGKPKKRPNRTDLRRLIEMAQMLRPGNHKIVGVHPWGSTDVYDVRVIGSDNCAAGEVFLIFSGAHGT